MTDRELLELAAKAAGVEYTHNSNPLNDDALALRLAVKLALDVSVATADADVVVWDRKHNACFEDLGSDPYAATRRAIVRAAAEIGKGM